MMKTRTIGICVVFVLLALSWGFIASAMVPPGLFYMVVAGTGGAMLGLAMVVVLNRMKNKQQR
jgi:uncharacterized membrane protein YeaQ/YmgE (transglycosylase-associated protein family)